MITIVLLILGGNKWTDHQSGDKTALQPRTSIQKVSSTQAYFERGSITITSDNQLNNSAVTGFTGNGTIDDPILIKGYNITFSSGTLIYISDTTYHFRIANNLLNGMNTSMFGISLSNTINGVIENNTIYNIGPNDIGNTGIQITAGSENNSISNNIVYNSGNGIGLEPPSNHNIIVNNSIYNCGGGIGLGGNNNYIVNNTIHDVNTFGIFTGAGGSSNNQTITENEIYNCGSGHNGINIEESNHNTITRNVIHNCDGGIGLGGNLGSNDNVVKDNEIKSNDAGITLDKSINNSIINNFISDNGNQGMMLYSGSDNNTISGNVISNNEMGFVIDSDKNIISENVISDNDINLLNGNDNNFTNNVFYNNYNPNDPAGIRVSPGVSGNIFSKNDFAQNSVTLSQVDDSGTNTLFLNNHWSDWTGTGPYSIGGFAENQDPSPLINPYHLSVPAVTAPTYENLTLADNVNIAWNASSDTVGHAITYSVFYSTNDGGSWTTLGSGLTTTNYTLDTTTIADGTNVLIKIHTIDSVGFVAKTVFSEIFLIGNTPHQLSLPSLIFPAGGETLSGIVDISWTASVDSWGYSVAYNVSYSADGGSTWIQLALDLEATSLSWDTKLVSDGSNYLLKLVAISSDLNTSSTTTFAIDNPPTLIIDSPLSQTYTTDTITVSLSGDANQYWYFIESVDSHNQTWITNTERTLSNGVYTLHVYGNDSTSNIVHVSQEFIIDILPPTVTFDSPLGQTYTTNTITVSLSGDADHYWYYIEFVDSHNQTWTTNVERTIPDGFYVLHAYSNDSAGNVAHVLLAFTIDTSLISTTPSSTTEEPTPGWTLLLVPLPFLTLISFRRRKKTLNFPFLIKIEDRMGER
jgi:parallel beta-helix repeat protein